MPDAIAVICDRRQISYGELNSSANQLAHDLTKLGVGPESLVGICVERTLEMFIGIMGVLKAGGAYVPVDPAYPEERISFILKDARVSVLLTQRSLLPQLPQCAAKTLSLDSDPLSAGNHVQYEVISTVTPDNLAYVIYTSGSTGRPKGVAVTHGSAVALLNTAREIFTDYDLSGVLASTSICFDLSVFELFMPLSWGGTVILIDSVLQLPKLHRSKDVTLIITVPSAIVELLRLGALPASVRTVSLAGEPLRTSIVNQIYQQGHVERVFDLYGPTEDTVYSTFALRSERGVATIGRPIAGTQVHLLDAALNPVPAGIPGEMHIAGSGLARGYLARPELTAEKFIPNPFDNKPGARLYKTGDLARYHVDGTIEYLGRLDHQVKIRGFRIEIGEVENALSEHPAVNEVVVSVREGGGGKYLVAYIVPFQEKNPSTHELRCFLNGKLPTHMVPSTFVVLGKLPLTPNGKVDRSALPVPEQSRSDITAAYLPPRTSVEKTLADIWSDVLSVDPVGVNDDFFELGGHSLRATQIVSRIRDAFEIEIPLNCIFASPTVARLAESVAPGGLEWRTLPCPAFAPALRGSALPLSFSQERVWFIQQLDQTNIAYNFQASFRFTGCLDAAALERSLNEIVRRHEIFRTTFPCEQDRPVQIIHDFREFSLPVIDLQGHRESEREAVVQGYVSELIQQRFDVTRLPLIRWTLFRLGPAENILLHVEHHLVHDGWSFTVFVRELLDLYKAFSAGDCSPLSRPPVQFADFAQWQREWLAREVSETQLSYWKRTLAGPLPVLALLTDEPRPPSQTFRGAAPRVELPADLSESVRNLCRREGVTLYMTLLAAFFVLLHRYSGQDDICVGSGIANRRWRETEQLIGMVVNNVVMRADVSRNPRFVDFLLRVRDVTLTAAVHQDVPFDHVVRALALERDPSRNPLFQVMFSFHDSPMPELVLPDLKIDLTEVLSNGSAKFDMNIVVIPGVERHANRGAGTNDGITFIWEYNSDLFHFATITRMIGHYQTLLESIVADPTQRLAELPLLTKVERHQVLIEWGETNREYPRDRCIHHLFEAQAERSPDAVAVVSHDERLSYGELNARANQLAHYLRKNGVGKEVLVGVCMQRSWKMVVALLGILKAGGAYVPLEPGYPSERLAFMLQDSNASMLLTEGWLVKQLIDDPISKLIDRDSRSAVFDVRLKAVCLDTGWDEIERESRKNLGSEMSPDSLAYVMYTSGSTGLPKGVGVPHRGVLRLLFGIDHINLDSGETLLQLAPISFDASVFELWGALLHGARCVIFPGVVPSALDLRKLLRKYGVSTLWLTASLFNHVVDECPKALASVRQLLIGGEALSVRHVRRALSQLNELQIINGYGPTEGTTFTCCYPIPRTLDYAAQSVPIGRPIANTQVYLLDRYLEPVPIGVPGELYLGGDGLARGYLSRPALTAERFMPNPFGNTPGERLYRTGDLARYFPDGNIEFLGRIDNQIKIRGFRIELGEIEAVLKEQSVVRDAVVVAREDVPGEKRLVGYIVNGEPVQVEDLRNVLKAKLPHYMVPSAFVFVDSLPLTPNGKIDRRALPAPDKSRPQLESAFVAPGTATEELVARTWADILKLKRVGVHDNFFELGGHSLLAIQVISRLREQFGVELPLRVLFEQPTVAGLAERIDTVLWAGERYRPSDSDTSEEREEIEL
jgi:amino acid adenylation domain-containing protein